MTSPAPDRTLEAMELMARAESAVEHLYETCAGLWKEDVEKKITQLTAKG